MNHPRTILTTAAAAMLAVGAVLAAGSVAHAADGVTGTNADTTPTTVAATDAPTAAPTDAADAPASAAPKAAVLPPAVHDVFGSLSVSPAGPYKDGQKVTYAFSGFAPNTPVVGSICIADIVLAGPQDCGSLNGPHTGLGVADATGKGTLTLTVVQGKLGATAPAYADYTCGTGKGHGCVFSLSDYSDNGPAKKRITYVAVASTSKTSTTTTSTTKSSTKTTSSASASTTADTASTTAASTSTGPALASTGGSAARTSGLLGVVLLLGGAVLLVVVRRPEATNRAA